MALGHELRFHPVSEASLVPAVLGGHGKSPGIKKNPLILPGAGFGEQVAPGSAAVADAPRLAGTLASLARDKDAPSPLPAGSGSLRSVWRWLRQGPSSLLCSEGSFCSSGYFRDHQRSPETSLRRGECCWSCVPEPSRATMRPACHQMATKCLIFFHRYKARCWQQGLFPSADAFGLVWGPQSPPEAI